MNKLTLNEPAITYVLKKNGLLTSRAMYDSPINYSHQRQIIKIEKV